MHSRLLALAAIAAVSLGAASAVDAQTPKRGGTLTFVVEGGPPDYDCHGGSSYVVLNYVAPSYSTLLKYDAPNYPKVVGDAADSWTVSADNLTYTFKLRPNIKFHD